MNRREFIKTSAGAFFIAPTGKAFGAAPSNRVRLALVGCGEALHLDPTTGVCLSKAGADKWSRECKKGWELV